MYTLYKTVNIYIHFFYGGGINFSFVFDGLLKVSLN